MSSQPLPSESPRSPPDALSSEPPQNPLRSLSAPPLNELRSRAHRADTPISTPASRYVLTLNNGLYLPSPTTLRDSSTIEAAGSTTSTQKEDDTSHVMGQSPVSDSKASPEPDDGPDDDPDDDGPDDDGPDDDGDLAKAETYDVNDCVEIAGWGRYQWRVCSVMGMMSVADASEIWITTIISKALVCEWGLSPFEKALIPFVIFFWMAVGSIISGFCIGANYGISICYTAEMVPKDQRAFNVFYLDMMWTAGSLYVCIAAYFVMDAHNGWRILVLITAVPCVATLVLLYWCDESPRYLAITNKKDEALAVLRKMCNENKRPMPKGHMIVSDQRRGEYKDIYKSPHTRTSVLLGISFFCEVYVFYGIMFLIPDMMSYGYCYLSQFFDTTYLDERGCQVYTKAEYLFFMVLCLCYIPGYIISPITAEKWGRKPTFLYSMWGSLVVTALFLICIGSVVLYIELALAITLYTIYIANLWLYIPEYYPTYIRSTATGVQNGVSKFGAALGTFLTEYLDTIDIRLTIYTYLVVILIAAIGTCFLKTETRGELLVDDRAALLTRQSNYGSISNPEAMNGTPRSTDIVEEEAPEITETEMGKASE